MVKDVKKWEIKVNTTMQQEINQLYTIDISHMSKTNNSKKGKKTWF